MKKLLIMLLTMLMMVSVVACSSKEDDKEKTEDTTKSTSDNKETEDKDDEKEDEKDDEKDDVVAEDGEVIISELSSKTLQEAIDAGYDYSGYAAFGDDIELYLQTDKVDDSIEKAKEGTYNKSKGRK